MITLRVLGGFELSDSRSGAAIAVTSQKARALLTVLAASPRLAASRTRLASLLWSTGDDDSARHSLRQTLSRLRRALEPDATGILVVDGDGVALDTAQVDVDIATLTAAAGGTDPAILSRAADLYGGPFGADLDLNEPEFETWLREQRERVRDIAIAVFDRLIRALAEEGRHDEALARALTLHGIDPLREETHRLLLTEEAIVSGRASALARYDTLRRLLREELGVEPEAETRRIADALRAATPDAAGAPPDATPAAPGADPSLPPTASPATAPPTAPPRRMRLALAAAALAAAIVSGVSAFHLLAPTPPAPLVGEEGGRLSLAVLPFESPAGDERLRQVGVALRDDILLALSQGTWMTGLPVPDESATQPPRALSQSLRVRYVLGVRLIELADELRGQLQIWDAATGITLRALPLAVDAADDEQARRNFTREVFRIARLETALHRARQLEHAPEHEIEALLWRAEAAKVVSRAGEFNPETEKLYDAILERKPEHQLALQGLASHFTLKVSRNLSADRDKELDRAEELYNRARGLDPNSADIAFLGAMIDKLRFRFPEALEGFARTTALNPSHWMAPLQQAHVLTFLGRLEEGYAKALAAMNLPANDHRLGDSAYIAGEIALLAGQDQQATEWLRLSVRSNPTVGRDHALYAAALELTGRSAEALEAAATARRLNPTYTPDVMGRRGGKNVAPRFVAARDRYVAAFRAVYDPGS